MRNKNFKNIGNVAINEIALCDTIIGLYMPIEKMSKEIRTEYEDSEKHFTEKIKKNFSEIDLTQHTLFRDVALHMNINDKDKKVHYSVAIILWIEDEQGNEIHTEFYDPFEVEINDEDNKYLKKLVMNKLMDSFF
ncbi:MAG: hypothetical protein IJA32_01960 [Lachnospiraceae bacterium]|nr:hypothetical protein [Lachnospiraceae bacterium]